MKAVRIITAVRLIDMDIVEHVNKWWWGKTINFVKNDGKAIVELQMDDNYPRVIFIKGLSVIELERRKGLGTELLALCERVARKECAKFLQLTADKEKEWLVEWYKKHGFVVFMHDEHEEVMVKAL